MMTERLAINALRGIPEICASTCQLWDSMLLDVRSRSVFTPNITPNCEEHHRPDTTGKAGHHRLRDVLNVAAEPQHAENQHEE